jgi:ABC-type phosphate/phosphonate transport system substrate-binding protein
LFCWPGWMAPPRTLLCPTHSRSAPAASIACTDRESAARIEQQISKYDAGPSNERTHAALAKSEARELIRKLEELTKILDNQLGLKS